MTIIFLIISVLNIVFSSLSFISNILHQVVTNKQNHGPCAVYPRYAYIYLCVILSNMATALFVHIYFNSKQESTLIDAFYLNSRHSDQSPKRTSALSIGEMSNNWHWTRFVGVNLDWSWNVNLFPDIQWRINLVITSWFSFMSLYIRGVAQNCINSVVDWVLFIYQLIKNQGLNYHWQVR